MGYPSWGDRPCGERLGWRVCAVTTPDLEQIVLAGLDELLSTRRVETDIAAIAQPTYDFG